MHSASLEKSGILQFPIGMAGKHQKSGKIPPKAGRLAAMLIDNEQKNISTCPLIFRTVRSSSYL